MGRQSEEQSCATGKAVPALILWLRISADLVGKIPDQENPRTDPRDPCLVFLRLGGSVQPEVHFHADHHRHGLAIFLGGIEAPLFHGFNCLLVQAHAKRVLHMNLLRPAGGIHHQKQYHRALVLGFARLFGILRIGLVQNFWSANATADAIGPTTVSAAVPWTNTGASARTHAATATATNAGAVPRPVGGRSNYFR